MPERIVIVGGVAAGASAAAKARRTNEQAEIVVYEKGPFISFANCGLPYYLSGDIAQRDSLLVVTPTLLSRRFQLEVRTEHEVLSVDAAARRISVRGPGGRTFSDGYDKLILATGSSPIRPRLPGIDGPDIHTLTTIPDAEEIRRTIEGPRLPRQAVVVGLGPIGLEVAEAMLYRGISVTLVDMAPQALPGLDPEMASPIARHLAHAGAELILGDAVAAFHSPRSHIARLQSGKEIPFDLAILSIGVRPNLELARSAGLAIGEAGGVVVDSRMRTSDPNIYAAGDIVESTHLVTGQKVRMPLAAPANRQGRTAGANAAGGDEEFRGVLGTFIVRVRDMATGKTGLSEREAQQAGLDYWVSLTHSPDHATYFPGSTMMSVKLVAERGSGRLLGAQVTGRSGVDKRLDVFATAIAGGLTVEDLGELDLAYAPPFSSARDPAVMAGMVAHNIVAGQVRAMTPAQLLAMRAGGERPVRVIDVRTVEEHARGSIPDDIHIPLDELRSRLGEVTGWSPDGATVVYCRSGQRSYQASRILAQHGVSGVYNLAGGYLSYMALRDAQRLAGFEPEPRQRSKG
jgi:NADPH-dependent 2,4-dienoyl-CoA reductase/sulfur reductase-like enzyme/rhodanese-related sulfurtransferase